MTAVSGVPCTTVARTLLDLADLIEPSELERVWERAQMLRLLDVRAVDEQCRRGAGRRRVSILRGLLLDEHPETLTRNVFEERFLALCVGAGIPRPQVNAWLQLEHEAFQVDFLWRSGRLIAETDGRAAHGTRQAFERDRRRDRLLLLEGWRVLRFTWRQLTDEPAEIADALAALLTTPRVR